MQVQSTIKALSIQGVAQPMIHSVVAPLHEKQRLSSHADYLTYSCVDINVHLRNSLFEAIFEQTEAINRNLFAHNLYIASRI